jgi:hypothetical protein
MKSIILAALVGTLTFEQVSAISLDKKTPNQNVLKEAEVAAAKAGVKDEEAENKAEIAQQKPAEV